MATTTAGPRRKQQRRQAARWYALRVFLLLALMSGIAYAAWFAPGSRHAPSIRVEAVP